MKNINRILVVLFIVIAIFAVSCSSSKKSNCGCPNKKGYIGY